MFADRGANRVGVGDRAQRDRGGLAQEMDAESLSDQYSVLRALFNLDREAPGGSGQFPVERDRRDGCWFRPAPVRMRAVLTVLLPALELSALENCGKIQSFPAFSPYLVREVA